MIKGLDVSHYQNEKGAIDWKKVKAAGFDFVYIKATEALAYKDPYYKTNVDGARKAGLIIGSYHFGRYNNAEQEADFFISVVGAMQDYDFLVLDWEIEGFDPDEWCREFLDRCYKKTGVRPLFYTNEDRVKRIDWKKVVAGNYGLIVAKYGDNDSVLEDNEIANTDEFPFAVMQQFTSNMTVPGITGRVDANIGNLTIDALKKYGKQPSEEPSTPDESSDKQPIGKELGEVLDRCGASASEKKDIGDNYDGEKDGNRIADIVNRKVDALEKQIKETPAGSIKIEPEFAEAIAFAHDINITSFNSETQKLIAFRETELKKSELSARSQIDKIKNIINQ